MMVILGEKLRCISDKLHWFEFNNIYEVVAINGGGSDMKISFKNCEIEIHACQLDSFERIPAVQKYTFDDLIDVARKAFDDGVLQGYAVEHKLTKSLSVKFSDTKVLTWCLGDDDYSIPIGHIKSLYKETFVIEVQEDVERLKNGAKVTLKNGEAIYFSNIDDGDYWFDFDHVDCQKFPFLALKGATVEQEKC